MEAKGSNKPGHQRQVNAIMNSIVPKSMVTSYTSQVQINKSTMNRFRSVIQTRRTKFGSKGYTKTEMLGPGKLGSEQLLAQGLARGDVTMRMVNGKEMYWTWNGEAMDEQEDKQGRSFSSTGDVGGTEQDQSKFFDAAMALTAEEFGVHDNWVSFVNNPTNQPKALQPPCSPAAMQHLQDAYDAMTSKLRNLKKLIMSNVRGPSSSSINVTEIIAKARRQIEEFEKENLDKVEEHLFKEANEVSDSQIKSMLKLVAFNFEKLLQLNREVTALLRC